MCWVWYNGASLCTVRDPERPNSGGGDYAVMAALGDGRLLSIVTGARSRLPGTPPDHGARTAAGAAGGDHHPPLPQPGAGNPPSRPADPRGESSKGAPGEQSPPAGPAAGAHPAPNAAQPRARQFRGAAGPSPTARSSPGAGPAGQLRGILCTRPAIPGDAHPPRPRAGPLIVSLAGSRARGGGAGGAVGGGAGGGRDRARGPTCPCRAGQWAPGVRKDRHIWTCSGAARAAGPRARPAPLKYGRGRPWSISLAAAGSRSASSRRSSARSSASYGRFLRR